MTPQEQIDILNRKLNDLKQVVDFLIKPDKYLFQKDMEFLNGINIKFGLGAGTKIGTDPSQAFAFFGMTPVTQRPFIAHPSGGAVVDVEARQTINYIIATLEDYGLTHA